MKSAIIVGSAGQDGSYLFDLLATGDNAVLGIERRQTRAYGSAFDGAVDVMSATAVQKLIEGVRPDEVYYLAAHHHSAEDKSASGGVDLFQRSYATHVLGLVNFLEAIRTASPRARLFYAASSHVFGNPPTPMQDESTPLAPRYVYGITKTTGVHCCRHYRESHGLHASVGILYNHESPRRRSDFLSSKIVRAAVAIRRGMRSELVVGDLSAKVDWGYAPDYVDAMVRIVSQPRGDDYVVATGQSHSARDFVAIAFALLGLEWERYVRQDKSLIAKPMASHLVGDSSKLRRVTGWMPTVTFEELVARMVRAEEGRDQ